MLKASSRNVFLLSCTEEGYLIGSNLDSTIIHGKSKLQQTIKDNLKVFMKAAITEKYCTKEVEDLIDKAVDTKQFTTGGDKFEVTGDYYFNLSVFDSSAELRIVLSNNRCYYMRMDFKRENEASKEFRVQRNKKLLRFAKRNVDV